MKLKWSKHCVIFCSKWIELLLNLTDFENIKCLVIPWKVRCFCSKPMKKADCCCSVAELCPTLCDPMDCSMPGFPVLHHLWKFAQTHVHWVSDAIQPSHLLLSLLLLPSSFPSVRVFSSKLVLHIRWSFSFSISPSSEDSKLIFFRIDWVDLLAVQGTLNSLLQYYILKASVPWLLVSKTRETEDIEKRIYFSILDFSPSI